MVLDLWRHELTNYGKRIIAIARRCAVCSPRVTPFVAVESVNVDSDFEDISSDVSVADVKDTFGSVITLQPPAL